MLKMFASTAASLAVVALTGCASHQLSNDVSTFSQWPADRKPASYVFERLPSQNAKPEQQQQIEDAARPAVEAAGFTPAADSGSADFSVQLGVRVSSQVLVGFDDPFFWRGGVGFGYGRWGRGFGPGWGWGWGGRYDLYPYGINQNYEREVAVLIRDRKTGMPVYEARANNGALSPAVDMVLPAMFEAALKDFPNGGVNPRRVTVELPK